MSKRIEIFINPINREAWVELSKEIAKGNFSIEIVEPKPTPIFKDWDKIAPGAMPQVIGYRPSQDPPRMYIKVGEQEDRLYKTARDLLDYLDKYGIKEFDKHFGTKGVEGPYFAEFLRKFLEGREETE